MIGIPGFRSAATTATKALARTAAAVAAVTVGVLTAGTGLAPADAEGAIGTLSYENGVVVYRADPSIAHEVEVNWGNDADPPSWFDVGLHPDIAVDPSCATGEFSSFYVACSAAGSLPRVDVYLGGGDDSAGNAGSHGTTLVRMFGAAGNDTLTGGAVTSALYGQAGDDHLVPDFDTLSAYAYSPGDLVSGGTGNDTLELGQHGKVVRASLDGKANDGPDGEKDNYLPDIETVIGATEGRNVMVGSKKDDTLIGGALGDKIDGKGGRDTLGGGDGDDTITSRDGKRDVVKCGPGTDKVVADEVDKLVGCEHVA